MVKFNSVVLTAADGTKIHFVTRGRSKVPTMDEVTEYMNDNNIKLYDFEAAAKAEEEIKRNWKPASNKLFLSELRNGLAWCASKYGVSKDVLKSYMQNVMPHINSSYYIGSDDDEEK